MVFVDTSAFFAWYVRRDSLHQIAVKRFRDIEDSRLITTNHVVEETLTLIARKVSYSFAGVIAERFYAPNPIDIVHTDRVDESAAITFFRKFSDQRVGFTDCISFAIMRRTGISTAFTFDRHFVDAGFKIIGLE
jgi:predicted nucleic acid-binding protein